MSNHEDYVLIPGSERQPLPGARVVGKPDGRERIEVNVLVRRSSGGDLESRVSAMGNLPPGERSHLDREQFGAEHGADPEDLEKIKAFARANNLEIVGESLSQRRVTLSGTLDSLCGAFGVELALYEHPGGSYRGRRGPVMVPSGLGDIVQSVHGLDDRPAASPRFRARIVRPHTGGVSYTPPQLAKLYDFPTAGDGQGQSIAIIELGGGYRAQDLADYFTGLKVPQPRVSAVSVDGGHNQPTGDPNGPDGEVALEIEVAGAIASGANIIVYFAPNTDRGFLDAINTAVHDAVNKPSVVSISWGSPEDQWTAQSITAFDRAFQDAAALGVTVCCAAGDGGSTDGEKDDLQARSRRVGRVPRHNSRQQRRLPGQHGMGCLHRSGKPRRLQAPRSAQNRRIIQLPLT
ncbi:MAG: S53 family peptidase [Rubrobacteraceae bacterium]